MKGRMEFSIAEFINVNLMYLDSLAALGIVFHIHQLWCCMLDCNSTMSWKIAGQSHNYWRQYEISYTYFEIRLAKNQLNWADAHLIAYI